MAHWGQSYFLSNFHTDSYHFTRSAFHNNAFNKLIRSNYEYFFHQYFSVKKKTKLLMGQILFFLDHEKICLLSIEKSKSKEIIKMLVKRIGENRRALVITVFPRLKIYENTCSCSKTSKTDKIS